MTKTTTLQEVEFIKLRKRISTLIVVKMPNSFQAVCPLSSLQRQLDWPRGLFLEYLFGVISGFKSRAIQIKSTVMPTFFLCIFLSLFGFRRSQTGAERQIASVMRVDPRFRLENSRFARENCHKKERSQNRARPESFSCLKTEFDRQGRFPSDWRFRVVRAQLASDQGQKEEIG